jgi:UDP-glucuronate 4-epimerase
MVIGVDNFHPYYSPARKRANVIEIQKLADPSSFVFLEGNICDSSFVEKLFAEYRFFDSIVHLAAMAGIRSSISDPVLYFDVNLQGTLNLLEGAVGKLSSRRSTTGLAASNFVFASTSSVYGASKQIPFVETDPCDQPLAPYAASKRAAEIMGYTYYHLYGINFTALRFFTVYGPRNRPDMLAYKIAESIFKHVEVPLYNNGNMYRDWTYITDIVQGVLAAIDRPLGYEIINLGRGKPVLLADFIRVLEKQAGGKAHLVPSTTPDTEMPYTYADISKARSLLDYQPTVSLEDGVRRLLEWYQQSVLAEEYGNDISCAGARR